jgi:TonB family protein
MWVGALLAGVMLPLLPSGMLSRFGSADAGLASGTATVTSHAIVTAVDRWTLSPLLCSALVMLYLLTVLFGVTRLLWRCWRTAAMARRSAMFPLDAADRMLVEGAARRFGIAPPEVRCSHETRGPVMVGVKRAMLLAPKVFFAAGNAEDIAAALTHECAHIARRDFAKNLVYEVVAAMVAYHPACWLMRRRIAETRELVCDDMAAGALGGRPDYAASLLRLATTLAGPGWRATPAIGVFDGDILEERIMRLTMDMPKVSRMQRVAMVALASCALLGGAATAAALSFDVMPQDSAAAPTQMKVYKIGDGVTPPVLTHSVDAEFTQKAKLAKHEGVSVVSCVVDSDGMPQRVHTIRKLGMGLDEKAIEAVRQYRFKPGMLNGKPVAVAITIEVNFHIY